MKYPKAVERVFYHEIGHFLAREINQRFYKGTKVKAIRIFPCGDADDFCGGIDVELPPNFDGIKRPPPKERLAENLGGTVYGCFLQAYITGIGLDKVKENNGQDDAEKRISFISYNGLKEYENEFADVETEHFELMRKSESLTSLKELNPANYLTPGENQGYHVDVKKLRNDLHKVIEEHHECYANLINQYNGLMYKDR